MKPVSLLLMVFVIGLAGCRQPHTSATSVTSTSSTAATRKDPCATTGPLTQQAAEQEALKAVLKEAGRDHACSIASVKDHTDAYEVCVRIDPPPSQSKQLAEHWTVEIPKAGITQNPNAGGG